MKRWPKHGLSPAVRPYREEPGYNSAKKNIIGAIASLQQKKGNLKSPFLGVVCRWFILSVVSSISKG